MATAFLHRGDFLPCLALALFAAVPGLSAGAEPLAYETASAKPTLAEARAIGIQASRYRQSESRPSERPGGDSEAWSANLKRFEQRIRPVLEASCHDCHGPDTAEANLRIDKLDPDLFNGDDSSWWLEVLGVLTNREMPPPDTYELADEDRKLVIDWLSHEVGRASSAQRAARRRTSFRRLARYEYTYALQDLLGLPFDFGKDLPPEPVSEDGFENSSEMLHMSPVQLAAYRESARGALLRATVRGPEPKRLYWAVSIDAAAEKTWAEQRKAEEKLKEKHADDPEALEHELEVFRRQQRGASRATHYKALQTGAIGRAAWRYHGARFAWAPQSKAPTEEPPDSNSVAVIPPRRLFVFELGDRVPDRGMMRVRARASRDAQTGPAPSLQLEFGWQASNDSEASIRVDPSDTVVDAPPGEPEFYAWEFPLSEIYPRNSFRGTAKLGELPNPSEFLRLVNSSLSGSAVRIDYVEVTAPVYDQWPPPSHAELLGDGPGEQDEIAYAREVLGRFMRRAWRRDVTEDEVEQKVELFQSLRPNCDDCQEAMVETLTAVLSSPQFLYLRSPINNGATPSDPDSFEGQLDGEKVNQHALASRLSTFLWCSQPDDRLLGLASVGELAKAEALRDEVERMLGDPRSRRFAEQFVRQWLGTASLAYLEVDQKAHRGFDQTLREAMQQEPVAFFNELLRSNGSVLDFLHADYTIANERLAAHYGLSGVSGNHFRRVALPDNLHRGGLLTLPGLLAMNSDGKDSHPLKRGIWLLERLLDDPPPPPPPAVPEIDVADPRIAKLTLKQRLEDHRNDPACLSCHANIDPWGVAFENFDAVGRWRNKQDGQPIDAAGELPNGVRFDGVDGLKRFLLRERQDQFVRALVSKMATFALGRHLSFADHAAIDEIAKQLRVEGDGLATLVTLLVTSDLFRQN